MALVFFVIILFNSYTLTASDDFGDIEIGFVIIIQQVISIAMQIMVYLSVLITANQLMGINT